MSQIPTEPVLSQNTDRSAIELQVSAPGKVILFGEFSVVYGKLALASCLDSRTFVKITEISAENALNIQLMALDFSHTFDLKKTKEALLDQPVPTEDCKDFNWQDLSSLKHESFLQRVETFVNDNIGSTSVTSAVQMATCALFYLFSGILCSADIEVPSLCISVSSELKLGAGTGSSASFSVALAAAFIQYLRLKVISCKASSGDLGSFKEPLLGIISKWAYYAERIMHGNPSGIDNSICTYGSFIKFRKGAESTTLQTVPLKILLIDTNVPRNTKTQVSKLAELYKTYPDLVSNILNTMENIAVTASEYLTTIRQDGELNNATKYFEELIRLSGMNHSMLKALGVSHVKLEEAMYVLEENGLKGKLTGAGGGGYAICILPPSYDESVVQRVMLILKQRGFGVSCKDIGGSGVRIDH